MKSTAEDSIVKIIVAARLALVKYGRHLTRCKRCGSHFDWFECDCGYDAAVAALTDHIASDVLATIVRNCEHL